MSLLRLRSLGCGEHPSARLVASSHATHSPASQSGVVPSHSLPSGQPGGGPPSVVPVVRSLVDSISAASSAVSSSGSHASRREATMSVR